MKKVICMITGLNTGGAERMLLKLLSNIDKKDCSFEVVSLMDNGALEAEYRKLNIPINTLGMKRGTAGLKSFLKAISICKDADVIHTWMYHADLLGFLVKVFIKKPKLIWGIQQSNLSRKVNKKFTLFIVKINAYFSKYVDVIVSCSVYAIKTHIEIGYKADKFLYIPNGFDISEFKASAELRDGMRQNLGVMDNTFLLVNVGRWDVQKDYPNLINSLRILVGKGLLVKLVLCGSGLERNNTILSNLLDEYELNDFVILLGSRVDIPNIMNAGDLFVSSSSGEGFANVIGEAMAVGLPCVVTDVGDSANIVGDSGVVVPPSNALALANAIEDVIKWPKSKRLVVGEILKKRIEDNFEIHKISKLFLDLYTL